MNKRVEWIDLAKGLGMLLVILGHCVCFGGIMHNAIFAFHMPLFFILSGIVYKTNSKGIDSKQENQKFNSSVFYIFYIGNTS